MSCINKRLVSIRWWRYFQVTWMEFQQLPMFPARLHLRPAWRAGIWESPDQPSWWPLTLSRVHRLLPTSASSYVMDRDARQINSNLFISLLLSLFCRANLWEPVQLISENRKSCTALAVSPHPVLLQRHLLISDRLLHSQEIQLYLQRSQQTVKSVKHYIT